MTPPVRGTCCWGAWGVPGGPPGPLFHLGWWDPDGGTRKTSGHPSPSLSPGWDTPEDALSIPDAAQEGPHSKALKYMCFSVFNTKRAKRHGFPRARERPPPQSHCPSQALGAGCRLPPPWLAAMGSRLLKQVSMGKRRLLPLAMLPAKGSAHPERGWRAARPTTGLVPCPRLSQPPHRASCPGPGLAGSWLPGRAG